MPVVGGPSGCGLEHPESVAQLAGTLGLDDVVRFVPPVAQSVLADWYAAATLVCVPSYNESFGLVAVEAQASGTPVVAAAVGGLHDRGPRRRLRLPGRRPRPGRLRRGDGQRSSPSRPCARSSRAAPSCRPAEFTWDRTADRTVEVYRQAVRAMREDLRRGAWMIAA